MEMFLKMSALGSVQKVVLPTGTYTIDTGYNEITEWEPFKGIVAKDIHDMMMIKHEAIGKL